MNKKIKAVFITVGILVLAVVAIVIINIFPLFTMKAVPTGEISDTEILALDNKITNIFFVKADDGYILIDAGLDKDSISKEMNENNIDPFEIRHILMTHTDSDHVASLTLFPNAQIYMNEDELQMINGTTKRDISKYNSLPDGINPEDIILLTDKQQLTIGGHIIDCFKLPGHTTGCMAYLIDGDYLFTGDAFKVINNTVDIHPFTMDKEMSRNSIEQFRDVIEGSKLVLTTHYGCYTPDSLKFKK